MKKFLLLILSFLSQSIYAQTFTMLADTLYGTASLCPASEPIILNPMTNLTTGTLHIRWNVDSSDFPCDWVMAAGLYDNMFGYPLNGLWSCSSGTLTSPLDYFPPAVAGGSLLRMSTFDMITLGTYWLRVKLTDTATSYSCYETFIITRFDSLLPNAGTITGDSEINVGSAMALTESEPGGIWSATNSHATVSITGIVTGVSAGIDTMLYEVTDYCSTVYATKVITVNALPAPENVENIGLNDITVLPNPARDLLTITGLKVSTSYKVLSIAGTSVLEGTISTGNTIDIGQIPSGMYILVLGLDERERRFKRFARY